jgi:D-serine deaminase-like pyridoxal phosphate-dependent protein
MGMNRTGVLPDALEAFYLTQSAKRNLRVRGLHCYDGHINDADLQKRQARADAAAQEVWAARAAIKARGVSLDTVVMGGTPTFPCHVGRKDVYLSPGTLFINDHGYYSKYQDLPFAPAAAILTRVISRPAPGLFTLDLGHKAIGADPQGARGIIVSLPQAIPVTQSEEHWVFKIEESGVLLPKVGDILFVIPTHICPTVALYDEALFIRDGRVSAVCKTTARNRKITV